jgi:hypothetical protein
MEDIEKAKIKLSIFNAVISSGSSSQKDNWKQTAEEAFQWVVPADKPQAPRGRPKKV